MTINLASSEYCESDSHGCLVMTKRLLRTAIETLLERGFVPFRTIVLAFGSDEEHGGRAVG